MVGNNLESIQCVRCGCIFGVPSGYLDGRRLDKESFYCPNGHSMSYNDSEADKLRRERDRLKQQLAEKDDMIADERRYRLLAAK
jgi:hypothetical protein